MKTKPPKISKILSSFLTFFLIVQILAGAFWFVPKPQEAQADGASWYNSNWLYRKPITIDNTGSTNELINYRVEITLNSSNFDFSKAQSNGEDLRFTDSDGTTLIGYWIESYDSSGQTATIWPKVPSIPASSTKTIYMYYEFPATFLPCDYIKLSVDSTTHNDYGLAYPVTYQFSIPSGSSNLKAYKRYTEAQAWTQIIEKTSSDFFNGIEAVRFDYLNNRAYVSVAFSDSSDEIHLKVTDVSDQIMDVTYIGIPDYYDNRDAVVTVTGDDWWKDPPPGTADYQNDAKFKAAVDALRNRHIWFTAGICTDTHWDFGWIHPVWSEVQAKIDAGYLEAASHSATHPYIPYADYDREVGTSKNDLINNLDLPYKKGSSEYIYAFLEPYGQSDSTVRSKLGQYKYLADRDTSQDDVFANWDITNSVFNWIGSSLFLEMSDLITANDKFDTVVSAKGIYHIAMHPRNIDWSEGSWALQHLDYIKEKTNLWYVGFGYLYLYHYIDDRNIVSVKKIGWEGSDDTLSYPVVYDDFPGSTLNTEYWTEEVNNGNGTVSVGGGNCTLDPEDDVSNNAAIKSTQSGYKRLKARLKSTATTLNKYITLSLGSGSVVPLGGWWQATFNDGYVFRVLTDTNAALYKMTNGSYSELDTYSTSLDTLNFHEYELIISDSGVSVEYDGVEILSSTDTTYTNGYGLIAGGEHITHEGDTIVINWARLSKQYTSPEPLISVGDEQAIPIAVTIGIPTALSTTSIRWYFTDNADNETGFKLYDDQDNLVSTNATADLSYIDGTGLSENTQYTGRYIRAYNPYGNSSSSATSTAIYTLADIPTNLTAIDVSAQSITLSVDALPNATADQSGYYFYRADDEANRNSGWVQTNTWQDSGLACGINYTYYVKYRNGDGVETDTVSLTQTTDPCAIIMIPQISALVPRPEESEKIPRPEQPSEIETNREVLAQQIKAQIAIIQQKIIQLIAQLIQLIQERIDQLQAQAM